MEKRATTEGSFDDGHEDGYEYDAVVVGSGYGGSIAACQLSMAGVKVCLIEKGRRLESKDFPTDSSKILSTMRMENQNLGISFGPKDALFQALDGVDEFQNTHQRQQFQSAEFSIDQVAIAADQV